MVDQLTILAVPINAVGHVNACRGVLAPFLSRGHRVVFFLERAFQGKLKQHGFEEYVITYNKPPNTDNPGEHLAKTLLDGKVIGPFTEEEKMQNVLKTIHNEVNYEEYALIDLEVSKAIERYKPQLIVYDGVCLPPSIYYSRIPFVRVVSTNPIFFIRDHRLPPGGSGYASNEFNREKWSKFDKLREGFFESTLFNDWLEKMNYPRYPNNSVFPSGDILTVYACPSEINYEVVQTNPQWFNLEVFYKSPANPDFKLQQLIPEGFLNDSLSGEYSGNLILLTLGSMSVDLELMKRLIIVLGKTNHKYIVSKGLRHAEIELPRNMWGNQFLPQTEILPFVNLVITHGGNNTITETFYSGKKMLVLPLFVDQYDNAQRLHELGFGIRLDPYNFSESQLIDAVEQLLSDTDIAEKMKNAALRIQSLDSHSQLVLLIESLLKGDAKH